MAREPKKILATVLALLLPFVTCGAQWLLWGFFKPFVWFLFYPTVYFSSRIGGKRIGIVSTVISSLLVVYFFIPPQLSISGKPYNNLFSVLVFLIMGVLFSHTHDRLERIQRREAEALEAARTATEQLQNIMYRKQAEWRLRRLAEVVERIAAIHDLGTLMGIVRHAVRELTGADGATLVLRDGNQCHYADEDAIGPLWKGQRFPLEKCISGWSMLHAEPVVIEDIYADPRIPHEAYRPTFVKSLSMVPVNREQPVGAIGCYWQDRHRATEEELGLQQALADAMAVGLANLNLITQLETARHEAEAAADEIRCLNAGLERRVEERTTELQAANRELDAFAYAVSHDLRAPLRAMNGFSQALIEDFGDRLEGEGHEYLEQIMQASRNMGNLIDGLLSLSRTTRGDLNRQQVDLSAMASHIRDELEQSEPGRAVEWDIAEGVRCIGDGRMLEAVMRNLLGNSWKYTLNTAVPRIRFHSEVSDGCRVYSVSDNGAGFDMRHAGCLFKPFQRLHRQDEFPGVGIGLATVQRIIHRHGGEIVAVAEPGKGASFSFTLAVSEVSST